MTQSVIQLLSFFTLLSNIFVIAFLALVLAKKHSNIKIKKWTKVESFLKKRGIHIAFIIALTSMLGSLFLSEIADFSPCKLCWYQRILMYPLVIILGVHLLKRIDCSKYTVLPLSIIGGLLALYHYYLQMSHNPFAPCSTIGFAVSCSDRFTTNFGFITIPWMAFSGFVLITLFIYFSTAKVKKA